MSRTVTVAALQCALTDDVATNVARVSELIRAAAARGAQIVLPSELFEGHYFCRQQREDDFLRARPAAAHPTIAAMAALARELGVVIPVSFFEQDGPEYYNSVAVLDADGGHLGTYRKSHIPDGPGYQEKFFFKPGNTGFMAFATRYATIGVGICWDQWFPEAARCMALLGADILMYPTAIGSEPQDPTLDSRDHWQRCMQGHAAANVMPLVASNRIGVEKGQNYEMTFYGSSFIADSTGGKVAEADRQSQAVLTATFDLDLLRAQRHAWGVFRDRRPELYYPILSLDGRAPG